MSAGDAAPGRVPGSPADRRTRLLRYAIKLAALAVLVYYVLPAKVLGQPVYLAFPLGALLVGGLEAARLRWGFSLPTLREYERGRVASYVYWAASLGLLVAFFPQVLAVAALLAAAVADVGASTWRAAATSASRNVRYPTFVLFWATSLPLLAFLPSSPLMAHGVEGSLVAALVLAPVGALAAALVEGTRWPGFDDDLLMPLVPALVWVAMSQVGWALFSAVPSLLPWALPPMGFHLPWLSRTG